ncbi:MAG TPA: hydroxymethylbilane synthase, partial [Planctomycetaceae bacterium]|nr:hydroxymethylbilane synthase [Planctomycetaceae bacterium]
TIPSLKIAAMLKRVDPRDVIINKWKLPLSEIPDSAIIGTSSPRREAFIRSTRNELTVKPIRGNVETRLSKIGNGYDGVILAAAGLLRLGLSHVINEYLDTNVLIPDVGQGALAIQTRSSDKTTQDLVSVINDSPTFLSVTAERAFMRTLGGSCNMPAAAYAQIKNQTITIAGMACSYDGQTVYKDEIEGDLQFAEKIGCEFAKRTAVFLKPT